MNLTNKIILITGASSGIGHATAVALGKLGNTLIITARRGELLEQVAEEVRAGGVRVMCLWGMRRTKLMGKRWLRRL